MQTLEHGLRAMAAHVELSQDATAHWRTVIDSGSQNRSEGERIRLLSSGATQFRYFKDAWRNHVPHSRVSYDQHSGEPVWKNVKAFMGKIALFESGSP